MCSSDLYSIYNKLGAIDQGALVDNKRLGHMLQIAQLVQSKRDSRTVDVPSTAHRADGTPVPRSKTVGSKAQRELGPEDLEVAIQSKASIAQTRRRLREAGLLPSQVAESGTCVVPGLNSAGIESTFSRRIDVARGFPGPRESKTKLQIQNPGASDRLRRSDHTSQEDRSIQKTQGKSHSGMIKPTRHHDTCI